MKIINKKLISVSVPLFAFILLFPTIAYAEPFTDFFRNGLIQINDFFESKQYAPYATAIDFFFFSLLFMAIYLRGVKYAFKEVRRPEQVIAILLGLMTAFLLVLADFSVTILLPYINWLVYAFLFILYWRLLKGIKSGFWRFVLALALILLTIALVQGLFSGLGAPDTKGYFASFGGSLGSIQMPGVSAPGVPDYLKGMFEPKAVKTPPGEEIVKPIAAPSVTKERGFFGRNVGWFTILFIIILSGGGIYGYRKLPWVKEKILRKKGVAEAEKSEIQKIIKDVEKVKDDKMKIKNKMAKTIKDKNKLLEQGDAKTGYLELLNKKAEEDLANLFLKESRELIEKEEGTVKNLIEKEIEFIKELRDLKGIESDFLSKLDNWVQILGEKGVTIPKLVNAFNLLIKTPVRVGSTLVEGEEKSEVKEKSIGILWLIAICYNVEKKEDILLKELEILFDERHIEDLVKGKLKTVKKDAAELDAYNKKEEEFTKLLVRQLELQIRLLDYLKKLLSAERKAVQPAEGAVAKPALPEEKIGSPQIVVTEPTEGSEFLQKDKLKIKAEIKNYKIPEGMSYKLILFQIKGTQHMVIISLNINTENIEFEVEASKLEIGKCAIYVRLADFYPGRSEPHLDSNVVTINIK